MAIIKLIGFTGEIPRTQPRLLPEMASQAAFNTRLTNGDLSPIRKSRFQHFFAGMPGAGYKTIYKHAGDWLGWTGSVHAAPGPVAADRLYYTGDGEPKMRVGGTVYPLAVNRPTAPLSAAATGTPSGSGLSESRLYVYTWVTDFGEESEPCPISNEVVWQPGQTVTMSGFQSTPAGRNITKQRIYRSQSSTSGTTLYFIEERTASTANYIDSLPPTAIVEPLASLDWNAPPSTLNGLIALPNGMMAAFSGKDLYFCEPYYPHAWPQKYVLTMDYPIVGLGAFGTSIVVATTGNPYIVSGTAPDSMQQEKMELNLPCINARSIVDLGYAVAYASHDGLVTVSSAGPRVATYPLFSREEWMRLNPQTMIAGQNDGRYLAAYKFADADNREYTGSIILDLVGRDATLSRTSVYPGAFFFDLTESKLFYLSSASVYEWDAIGEVREIQSWKSKQFILPKPGNMGAILVEADDALTPDEISALQAVIDAVIASNEALFPGNLEGELNGAAVNVHEVNGDVLAPIPTVSQSCNVNIYADRKLVATVTKLNTMARLPSGFLAQSWEVEVSGDMVVRQVTVAGTGAELAGA